MSGASQGRTIPALAGKRIVLTRSPEQARDLALALERMGAEVLPLPTVSFAPPETWTAVDAAIRRLGEFDWLLFTSRNAARFFSLRCRELGMDRKRLQQSTVRVGAVGPATARAATEEGWRVDRVASKHAAQALARELGGSIAGKRVLLPRSGLADGRLPAMLREAGAEIAEVVAYRTVKPEKLDAAILGQIRRAEVDTIVFASPSAFHNLCDAIPVTELARLSGRVPFAAIGPTTAQALREAGVRAEIEASEASATALAGAIARHYRRAPMEAKRSA